MDIFTVANDVKTEFTEKKSVFIANVFFVSTEEEALNRIETVKNEYPDATHHCWAYRLRMFGKEKCSDDGEPQGTAGMPILNVIKANGITDVLVVVTRYFGGILLGAGGLVRAYTKGAADSLSTAGKAEITGRTVFEMSYGYDKHKTIEKMIEKFNGKEVSSNFTDSVCISVDMETADYNAFSVAVNNIYYCGMEIKVLHEYLSRKTI